MKVSPRLLTAVLVLLAASLACRVDVQLTDEPGAPDLPTEEAPTTAPIEEATASPTHTTQPPTAEPEDKGMSYTPSGFLMAVNDGAALNVYNNQGQMTGGIQTPGMGLYSSTNLHVAGPAPGGVVNVPVVFMAFDENNLIRVNSGGQMQTLVTDPELSYLVGAAGQPVFAYTVARWNGEALVSYLNARTIDGGGASWDMERTDPQSYAVQPLAVQAEDNQPRGVWFSLMPWGIGGDIVFSPRKGLYYLDLQAGGTQNMYLSEEFSPQGFSPDLTWIAYTPTNFGSAAEGVRILTFYNLYTTERVEIPFRPGSDRGAGNAVFSPDNQFAAWMEGSGWMMAETPNFHSKILVAEINGTIRAEIHDSTIAAVTGTPDATWVQPVGWLDGESLLVEVRGDNWNSPTLVRMKFDGGGLQVMAPGVFAGFIYP